MASIRWASRLVAALLLLAASLVMVGVSIESTSGHLEPSESSVQGEGGESHDEAGEGPTQATEPGLEGATLAGIPLESPLFIDGLAVASIVVAVAIWVRPGRVTGTLAILFSVAAAAFDVSEIQHQAAEGSLGLLAVAMTIVVLRLAAIVASVVVIRARVRRLRSSGAAAIGR
ncbi:MAG: hypothetical protein ABL886_06425 [Rhodoglobus sp.]